MTYLGAIRQLHELRVADDMPIYYKPAIAEVINVLLMDAQEVKNGWWIPCSERLPEEDGYYLVTNSKWGAPLRQIALWMTDGWSSDNKPVAWMPLPEPYEEER